MSYVCYLDVVDGSAVSNPSKVDVQVRNVYMYIHGSNMHTCPATLSTRMHTSPRILHAQFANSLLLAPARSLVPSLPLCDASALPFHENREIERQGVEERELLES